MEKNEEAQEEMRTQDARLLWEGVDTNNNPETEIRQRSVAARGGAQSVIFIYWYLINISDLATEFT